MAMPEPKVRYTYDDLAAMPDDRNRYEIIDGKLFVTPAPRALHQFAVSELFVRLYQYGATRGLRTLFAPADVWASDTTVLEPDVFAFHRQDTPEASAKFIVMHKLLLAVEVLSPSTARTDRGPKRFTYLREGIADYWIIDAEARTIAVHTPDAPEPRVLTDELRWTPIAGVEPFVLDLVEYFSAVHG